MAGIQSSQSIFPEPQDGDPAYGDVRVNRYLEIDQPSSLRPGQIEDNRGANYTAASMGFSILGGILKGMAAIQAGGVNAGIDRNNAGIDRMAAADARARGNLAAAYALLRGADMEGKQKVAFAGNGVDVRSGSALDTLAETRGVSHLDALMAENNAAREAWGYERDASSKDYRARLDEAGGRQQLGESILGGALGAASALTKYNLSIS